MIPIAGTNRFAGTNLVAGAVPIAGTNRFADTNQITSAYIHGVTGANDIAGWRRGRYADYR